MRQLFPTPLDDIGIAATYLADRREPVGERPWVVVNMATTADGATALAGRSGGIGGPADRSAFHALRSAADVVLAGAGTIRAEDYGPVRVPEELVDTRAAAGRELPARLASISRNCSFSPDARMFSDASQRPLLYVTKSAPPDRVATLADVAEIVPVGDEDVDLPGVFADLGKRGVRCVVCEGGPTLNGQLVAADLVDEWCLTLGPLLVAGPSARASHGPVAGPARNFRLDRAITDERDLLLRYVVER